MWNDLKERMTRDMMIFRARNAQGDPNPFTVIKSGMADRDDPEAVLISDLTLLVISDMGTRSLPKDPFFIPVYGKMQEYFLDILERFLFGMPRVCSFEEWKNHVYEIDKSFAEKWDTRPCSGKKSMFSSVSSQRTIQLPMKSGGTL